MKKPMWLVLAFIYAIACDVHAGWTEKDEPVMKGVGWHYPAAYGGKVVFDTGGGGGDEKHKHKRGTFLYDPAANKLTFLSDLGGPKGVYGDHAVFQSGDNVFHYDLKRMKMGIIGEGLTAPSIYDGLIVYERKGEIIIYNIKTKKEKRIKPLGKLYPFTRFMGPNIHGDTIVWLEIGKNGGITLASHSVKNGKSRMVREFSAEELYDIKVFKFQDGVVLFSNKEDVHIYGIKDDNFKRLTRQGSNIFLSSINKGRVVWDSNGGETITLYDIVKDEYKELVSKGASIYSVTTTGNKVFFVDLNKYEFRMFEFRKD